MKCGRISYTEGTIVFDVEVPIAERQTVAGWYTLLNSGDPTRGLKNWL